MVTVEFDTSGSGPSGVVGQGTADADGILMPKPSSRVLDTLTTSLSRDSFPSGLHSITRVVIPPATLIVSGAVTE